MIIKQLFRNNKKTDVHKKYFNLICISLLLLTISCKEKQDTQLPATDTIAVSHPNPKPLVQDTLQLLQSPLPQPTGFVSDYSGLFTPVEKDSLEKMIQLFEKETSIEIAVITLDSTMTTAEGLEETTLQIAKAWGVGKRNKNNGVTIGISKQFRKMRIQNGYGVEGILNDAVTKRIVDEDFIPFFKQGNYYEGTKKGLLSLMKKLRQKYTA